MNNLILPIKRVFIRVETLIACLALLAGGCLAAPAAGK